MSATLLHALLGITMGLLIVLAFRKPVRHAFGANAACSLWVLPWLLGALAWFPLTTATSSLQPVVVAPVRLMVRAAEATAATACVRMDDALVNRRKYRVTPPRHRLCAIAT